jgi:hypothetical protein
MPSKLTVKIVEFDAHGVTDRIFWMLYSVMTPVAQLYVCTHASKRLAGFAESTTTTELPVM